jgi:hypothetical protein
MHHCTLSDANAPLHVGLCAMQRYYGAIKALLKRYQDAVKAL